MWPPLSRNGRRDHALNLSGTRYRNLSSTAIDAKTRCVGSQVRRSVGPRSGAVRRRALLGRKDACYRASLRRSGRDLSKQQRGQVPEVAPPDMPGVAALFDDERVFDAMGVQDVAQHLVLAEHPRFL